VNTASASKPRYCPDCGAEVAPQAVICWCCRHSLLQSASAGSQLVSVEAVDENARHIHERTKFQFSLASVMLIVTLAAVLMSIYTMAPGLGIALMVLSVPALIRTAVLAMQKGSRGKPLAFAEKAGIFLAWIGLGIVIIIAAGLAFFVSCLAGLPGGEGAAMLLGSIGAIVVAIFLGVFFWRKFKF
jgi:hypothetical protein